MTRREHKNVINNSQFKSKLELDSMRERLLTQQEYYQNGSTTAQSTKNSIKEYYNFKMKFMKSKNT